MTAEYRSSFWKTAAAAGVIALVGLTLVGVVLAWAWNQPASLSLVPLAGLAIGLIALGTGGAGLVSAGALIALRRDSLQGSGQPYAHQGRREALGGQRMLRACRRLPQSLLPRRKVARLGLRPGEWVEIRRLDDILRTLDETGALNGVPFMPEMGAQCGKRARVFRRVEKLNDWVHGSGLKRMRDLVLLEGLRCDGSAHGGCQAGCHLRWQEAWLRRVEPLVSSTDGSPDCQDVAALARFASRAEEGGEMRYVCQATKLTAGGDSLRWNDPRHYIRDLVTGNVRFRPWITGIALAFFNWFQRRRGGVGFPPLAVGTSDKSPHEALGLQPGELVIVKPKPMIEATLNRRSRNRGLYFDRDMLRFCGGRYRVKTRVERVIIESTGALRELSNPCVILEGVTATGEYNGFNPENEYIFWREIWLERPAARLEQAASGEQRDGTARHAAG
jgi:hypothetical protein